MMHVHLIVGVVTIALAIRLYSPPNRVAAIFTAISIAMRTTCPPQITPSRLEKTWRRQWHRALIAFVVPPLLLLTTAIAIVTMGSRSCHAWEGWLSYGFSWLFLVGVAGIWSHLGWGAIKMQREVRSYPRRFIHTQGGDFGAQIMPGSSIFSAQVGLWSSDLVVSEGLLDHLDVEHLSAVLAHESGHAHYRDTFWFFWLGGLRRLTGWLPYSEMLWQELLLLREIRADRWATRQVDPLVLAESLMSVVTAPLMPSESVCPGFSCVAPRSRLAERVDALLSEEGASGPMEVSLGLSPELWMYLSVALSPLLTIPLHH